jgi:hypothetical protein
MAVDYPKIEGRDFDALLGEFKSLVPFYTPEWRLKGVEKGPDMALVKIFIHFLRIIYHRLNRLPEKHFIAFLDRIGVKLIPAQPAAVPVTFLRPGDIELKDVRLRVVTIRFHDLPTEAIRGIEAVFSRRLADQGIDTVGQLLEYRQRFHDVAGMIAGEEASLEYYEAMAKNFLENTAKHLLDEEYENMLITTAERRSAPEFYFPDLCLAANNLELADRLKESRDPAKVFKPFIPLEEESLCFYLAFDKKLEKGPVSLFFAVDERPVSPEQIPSIHWQYTSESLCWQRLDVLDATMSLTRSGVIEFVFPLNFKQTRRFGRKAYWLRAKYAAGPTVPAITGVFLNTAWALQCETIDDEILGAGDGTAGQTFSLKKTPVILDSQAVWVNEIKTISAEERTRILEQGEYDVQQVFDEKEKETVTAFWVRWKPVESILYASADDRCYEIDNVSGVIIFGDGLNGKIPPTDADNIKADYQSGGTDTETVERLMQRGPYLLKHRNRAITVEDVEQLAIQASPGIARVRCLANMNERREAQDGRVTVIVIPQTEEERPGLSLQLQRRVEQYLDRRAAYTLVEKDHLKVIGPVYVEVSVYARLVAVSVDEVPLVEKSGYLQLKDFLNPLTGGGERKGWDFGKIPCFSDFYALLEKIEGVDHVEELSLGLKIPDQAGSYTEYPLISVNAAAVRIPPYAVVCSGEHQISVGF